MLDLVALPARYLAQYGPDKVADVCGTTTSLMGMWQKRGKFPLDAVQKLLEFDPAPLKELQPLSAVPPSPLKVLILVPCSGPVDPRTMECLCALKEPGVDLITASFWDIYESRNILAQQFLDSSADIAFFSDADMIHGCGDAKRFRKLANAPEFPETYAGLNVIHRLLHHKKSLVGVAYRGRRRGADFQFGGSSSPEIRSDMKRGPRPALVEKSWMGFGGVLMQKKVLKDIIAQQGDEIRLTNEAAKNRLGYEYGFFRKESRDIIGDDIGFEERAKRAGHPCYVDMALFSSHIGHAALNYGDA